MKIVAANTMSDLPAQAGMQLAPEVEARVRAWIQSDAPMEIENDRERDARVEVLRRLGEQPETTLEDRIALGNLKRLTEDYSARQVYYSIPVTPEAATRLRAKLEKRRRIRNERTAAASQPAPRSGMWTIPRGHQRLFIRPEPGVRYACLCCRYLTLPERDGYDVCPICFWEDDGQDDYDADEVRGGSNHNLSLTEARRLSLTEARRNFAEFGACERRHTVHIRAAFDREHL